jgi:hypothetical protein
MTSEAVTGYRMSPPFRALVVVDAFLVEVDPFAKWDAQDTLVEYVRDVTGRERVTLADLKSMGVYREEPDSTTGYTRFIAESKTGIRIPVLDRKVRDD